MSRKLFFSVGYSIPGIPEFIVPLTWKWILNSQNPALTLNPHPCIFVVPPWDLIHLSFYWAPAIMLGKPEALHKSFSSYAIKIWGKGLKMWWRRNGNPLQYSRLENPMDKRVWWATAHVVTKSWTQLTPTEQTANVRSRGEMDVQMGRRKSHVKSGPDKE